MRKYKSLTKNDRLQLEALLRARLPVKRICEIMHRNNSTIYREIRRGTYQHLNGDTWLYEPRYSADKAQLDAERHNWNKGRALKIGKDHAFAAYIAKEIRKKHSPAVALSNIRRNRLSFPTKICVTTLYSYIDKGLIYGVTNKQLWVKGKRKKRKYHHPQAKSAPRGNSIDTRPAEVLTRETFGNWEMDSVIGTREKGKTIINIVERKTRFMLSFVTQGKTAAECVRLLNILETRANGAFPAIFQTITADNGTEFADYPGIETSPITKERRTTVYYCHPYRSSERGTNENHNGFLRRFIPKGTPIEHFSPASIRKAAAFMNTYPRKILDWHTPQELFESELSKLGIQNPEKFIENFCNIY